MLSLTGGALLVGAEPAASGGSGAISGTVTDELAGTPLAGICVGAGELSFLDAGLTFTNADGTYEFTELAGGDYRVLFSDCTDTPTYISEWFDGRPNAEAADLVHVTDGAKTSRIDAQLAIEGFIRGTVTASNTGEPLSGICVEAFDLAAVPAGLGLTDGAGAYLIDDLAPGDYTIVFANCAESASYHLQWYDDRADFDTADAITVAPGATATGISADLVFVLLGDVSCSGTADSVDAALLLQHIAGLLPDLRCETLGDVDADGRITSIDAALILQLTAGLLDTLPP